MRARVLVVALAAVLALAGCGSSSNSSSSSGSTTTPTTTTGGSGGATSVAKFALHSGLAVGAFHRYIYKPLKAGDLSHPLSHKLTLLKAAAAAAFVVHEVELASAAAKESPRLSKLVAPLNAFGAAIRSAVAAAKGGKVDNGSLDAGETAAQALQSQATSAGASVLEQVPRL